MKKLIQILILQIAILLPTQANSQNFWNQILPGPNRDLSDMVINPSTGHIFAVESSTLNIVRSTNGGQNWTPLITGSNGPLTIAMNSSGHIFVGGSVNGIFRSTNNGNNWTQINTGINWLTINRLFVSKITGYIYASTGTVFTGNGPYRSTNNGDSWTLINNNISTPAIYSFVETASGRIFAGSTGGLVGSSTMYTTTNNGDNWSTISSGITSQFAIIDMAYNSTNGDLYAVSTSNIWKSTDTGNNWISVFQGSQPNSQFKRIVCNSTGGIFMCSQYGDLTNFGVFRSTNNGNNWAQINTGLNSVVWCLAFDQNNFLYGAGSSYFYKSATVTNVAPISSAFPIGFKLEQNYPNPFNPSTTIKYSITKNSNIAIRIFDLRGKEIKTLVDEFHNAGYYSVNFNSEGLSSGVYFYKIYTDGFSETKQMLLIK